MLLVFRSPILTRIYSVEHIDMTHRFPSDRGRVNSNRIYNALISLSGDLSEHILKLFTMRKALLNINIIKA